MDSRELHFLRSFDGMGRTNVPVGSHREHATVGVSEP